MKKLTIILAVAMLTIAFASNANALTWALGMADIYAAGGLDVDISGPNGDYLTFVPDPCGGTIGLDPTVQRLYIGQGWATWSHGFTGPVLANFSAAPLRLTFDGPVAAFGCYAEPNVFDNFDITLGLSSGETLTKTVQGQAGADFFGFYGGSVDWLEFSSTDQSGFAIGEMVKTCVPEPGTLMLLGSGLLGLGLIRRKK